MVVTPEMKSERVGKQVYVRLKTHEICHKVIGMDAMLNGSRDGRSGYYEG